MLRQPDFFRHETGAPLLIQNCGYLESQGPRIFDRVAHWLGHLDIEPDRESRTDPVKMVPRPARIVVRDAERTFLSDHNRQILIKILTMAKASFGDYQQTMGYVGAFFLLFFEPPVVLEMLSALNNDPKYIPGYWKHEAVAQANDSWALIDLVQERDPEMYTHTVDTLGCYPDTYCQKWFGGLSIQVLPFDHLFKFFDGFLEHGYRYLFKFGLSLFTHLRDPIMGCQDVNQLYAVLRFDRKVKITCHGQRFRFESDHFARIIDGADSLGPREQGIDGINFAELRETAYATHLRKRMVSAVKQLVERDYYDQDEIVFTDEDEDENVESVNAKIADMSV